MSRRDVLRAGAVGAGALLVRPWRATAASLPLADYIRDRMSAGKLPGLAATVLRGPAGLDPRRGLGERGAARTRYARHDLHGRVSKTVVATAVMQAVEWTGCWTWTET